MQIKSKEDIKLPKHEKLLTVHHVVPPPNYTFLMIKTKSP